jgi:hypothetical protein
MLCHEERRCSYTYPFINDEELIVPRHVRMPSVLQVSETSVAWRPSGQAILDSSIPSERIALHRRPWVLGCD